jgi:ATP-binding cassette subfamily C protein
LGHEPQAPSIAGKSTTFTTPSERSAQAVVTESLDRLRASRVVIAHRLSTVIGAERIVQSGTHGELIRQPGPVRDLVKRQIA